MTWQTIDISTKDVKAFAKAVSKQPRFLIDENINPELALKLRNVGYDAIDVFGLTLNGRSNEDVFAAAWREQRILMTQDRDFLDDCRFPPYRNAGVVVRLQLTMNANKSFGIRIVSYSDRSRIVGRCEGSCEPGWNIHC